jgi:hypothetical protein
MCPHRASSRYHSDGLSAFHAIQEQDLAAVANNDVDSLIELVSKPLEKGSRLAPEVHSVKAGHTDPDERRACAVGLRFAVLLDETVVLQHRQQPMSGGDRHTKMGACMRDPDGALVLDEQEQAQGIVNGLDGICGPSNRVRVHRHAAHTRPGFTVDR